jgi:hypothetical protein
MVLCVRVLAPTEGLGGAALVGGVLHILTWSVGREGLVSILQPLIYLVMDVYDFPEFWH